MLDATTRANTAIPESITLSADRSWLTASWPDGTRVRLDAGRLRAACRCAACTRAKADGNPPNGDGIAIVSVTAHGPHVGRLTFSDGHDRGLYPWAWLRELAVPDATKAPEAQP